MADNPKKFKLPQSNRARVLLVIVVCVGILLVLFSLYRIHRSRKAMQTGDASLSGVPAVSSLPGGKEVSQQYLKILLQQNQIKADNALKSGQTSIPTMVNTGQTYVDTEDFTAQKEASKCNCPALPGTPSSGASVLDKLAVTGAISSDVAADLQRLENQGASVSNYAAHLKKLVAEGKLTPDQASRLLAAYREKHQAQARGVASESVGDITSRLLSSGAITPETAKALADLNSKHLTPAQYKAALDRLVAEGALTPEQARQLLAAYRAHHTGVSGAAAGMSESPSDVASDLLAAHAITPETAKALSVLHNRNLTPEQYEAALKQMVDEGKLTPEQARQLFAAYKAHHEAGGMTPENESSPDVAGQLLASGAITPETGKELAKLNRENLTPAQYRQALQRMVAEGNLSPAQAARLMAAYNRKHGLATASAIGSGQTPDGVASRLLASGAAGDVGGTTPASVAGRLLADGAITPQTASELSRLDGENLTPQQYEARLAQLVKAGKLTPEQAAKLAAAYDKTYNKAHGSGLGPANVESPSDVADKLLASGQITSDVRGELSSLNARHLTPEQYRQRLAEMVATGQLDPEVAGKLLSAYKKHYAAASGSAMRETPSDITSKLLASGAISPTTAKELADLNHANLSPSEYQQRLARLVAEGKLTPAQAQSLLAAYSQALEQTTSAEAGSGNLFGGSRELLDKLKADGAISEETASFLSQLAARNVPASSYATQLATLARSGEITPQDAQRVLNAYVGEHGSITLSDRARGNSQVAQLEQLQQQQQLRVQQQVLAQLQQQEAREHRQETKQEMKKLEGDMRGQATTLLTAWKPPAPTAVKTAGADQGKDQAVSGGGTDSTTNAGPASDHADKSKGKTSIPMIKTGSIMFAVLNTAIDSDRPGVVMATIVSGKFKGAKLLGGLTLQKDRVQLSFTTMTQEVWPTVVKIKAVAINPDTARTAIASSVDYHYLSRYGSLMAASFLEGYGEAVENSGSTTISGNGNVTATSDTYSPGGRFMIALGNIGSKLSGAAEKNFNRSPTVKVDAGVGLGILFEEDVETPEFLLKEVQMGANHG